MIERYSSRFGPLDGSFLKGLLRGAAGYDRIAGYFCSSILEVAGEEIAGITGTVRVVCNAHLTREDVETAAAAQRLRQAWCASRPETLCAAPEGPVRLARLFRLLQSGKLQVRVLPDEVYGLIHGKAGVVAGPDGRRTAFLGSANETAGAFRRNYELIWSDDSPEGADWVQREFDFLWNSPHAVALCDFVVQDIGRLARRTVLSLREWRRRPDQALPSAAVETPLFREELGLWDHQKYFVELAFRAHLTPGGARFLLADQVGLGKTVQLALAAKLMALRDDQPVLILAPKALVLQWQAELMDLLDLPSAVWTGRGWQDETGRLHPEGLARCPRRFALVSQGLVIRSEAAAGQLLERRYACVIVDEAHRARRHSPSQVHAKPRYNRLLAFLNRITYQTHSLLLATATPVQIHPIEVFDLLRALGLPAPQVMGDPLSEWNRRPLELLDMAFGRRSPPQEALAMWDIMRNPFPAPTAEDPRIVRLREYWAVPAEQAVLPPELFRASRAAVQDRVRDLYSGGRFVRDHSPYLRHIVRRTREDLECAPGLRPAAVRLWGEQEADALPLEGPLGEAYEKARAFCALLARRVRGGGFLSTLLLRRMGSTLAAGARTAQVLLAAEAEGRAIGAGDLDPYWEDGVEDSVRLPRRLTGEEAALLRELLALLAQGQEEDPKYARVLRILTRGAEPGDTPWRERGCILFTQYYDSARWLAGRLSRDLPRETVGLYAGGDRSGCLVGGLFQRRDREDLKAMVQDRRLRLLVGTNAAGEGLNLQLLSALINLDLPWNPTVLEQRKGRIQRIGQTSDTIFLYNLRYRGSVEDQVHRALSDRLNDIYQIFGQIPDTVVAVWIAAAVGRRAQARARLDALPRDLDPPFARSARPQSFPAADWEGCAAVLDRDEARSQLSRGWADGPELEEP